MAGKPALGKIYIDLHLKKVVFPLAQRSASSALKAYAYGSGFALFPTTKFARAFIHWRNPDIHVVTDMGLTAIQLNKVWEYIEI